MTAFRRFSAIPAIAALVFSVSGSFAAAANTWNVLTQYQYVNGTSDSNLTSNWFAGVNGYYQTGTAGTVTAPGTVYTAGQAIYGGNSGTAADFAVAAYSNRAQVSGTDGKGTLYNYTSKSAITNTSPLYTALNSSTTGSTNFGTGASPPTGVKVNAYVAGPGMNYIVQNQNTDFGQNGANFRIRNQNTEFNIEGASNSAPNTSAGMTFLGYSSVAPTTISGTGTVWSLSVNTLSQKVETWSPGMQAAIQDTAGQWWVSAWASGSFTGTPANPWTLDLYSGAYFDGVTGTSGFGVMSGTTQGWYAYTPASLASASLALGSSGTSSPGWQQYFTGTAQAFGVFFGQYKDAATGIAPGFRMRGFEVIQSVPEPATVGLTALGLGGLVATRMMKRRLRRRS